MFEFNSNQYGALYCIHNSQFIICCGRNRFERPLAGSIALAIACDTFDTVIYCKEIMLLLLLFLLFMANP
jgi:hypothetical protein